MPDCRYRHGNDVFPAIVMCNGWGGLKRDLNVATAPEIAAAMHLSPKTVATYKYRIHEKLNTRNDVDMTRMAMRYGVVATA